MIAVVEADAEQLADTCDRRAEPGVSVHDRQTGSVQRRQLLELCRRQGGTIDIGHMGGQIPDRALGIEQPRFFGARGPVTQQFHGVIPPADEALCIARHLAGQISNLPLKNSRACSLLLYEDIARANP